MSSGYEYVDLEAFEIADMDSAAASVWMLLNTHVNEGKVVAIVEGKDDVFFYSRFFVPNSITLHPDGNCIKHSVILSALSGEYGKRILAIKDADFDRLNGVRYNFDNLFLTDAHDMEGMVLSKGIPDSFSRKYAHLMNGIELETILADLKSVSYLKWFNSRQTEKLKFKGLPLYRFYETTFSIDVKALFKACILNTANEVSWTMTDVERFEQENDKADVQQLYRGHDVFECIYIRAHKIANGHNLPKAKFFFELLSSYNIEDFRESTLCFNVKRWATRVGVNILV